MLATVCDRHKAIIPDGEPCPFCEAERSQHKADRNRRLGRTSQHWRRLSMRLIGQHRRRHGRVCPVCGEPEDPGDLGSKLTLDLVAGGDHSTARAEDCEVKCRRCHGRKDGGRRAA